MTKCELITEICIRTQIGKKETWMVIESMLTIIKEAMENDESVSLLGFGAFVPKHIPEKIRYDAIHGFSRIIPAHKKPHFRASPLLTKLINS